ncbi:putative surface protein [Reticulomyxa filosa]|uniref:Putative surface protein n=1 Tax=Reticulomyxa filosa TaxID=46433 RepID=X6MJ31_RETFI|nr:putative surface protein [Reticulomyxa filosa]|eukprot:ETO13681.1 putative surface protein [Reticulomyxa filosa]
MKGPQDFRSEQEHIFVPSQAERNVDAFDLEVKYGQQIQALKEQNEYLRSYGIKYLIYPFKKKKRKNKIESELGIFQARYPEVLSDIQQRVQPSNNNEPNTYMNGMETIHEMPPWIASSKYMSPLLVAYDNRIDELKQQIQQFQNDTLELRKDCEALAQRNTLLERQIKDKIEAATEKLNVVRMDHSFALKELTFCWNKILFSEKLKYALFKRKIVHFVCFVISLTSSYKFFFFFFFCKHRWREECKKLQQTVKQQETAIELHKETLAKVSELTATNEQLYSQIEKLQQTIHMKDEKMKETGLHINHNSNKIMEMTQQLEHVEINIKMLLLKWNITNYNCKCVRFFQLEKEVMESKDQNSELTIQMAELTELSESLNEQIAKRNQEIETNKTDMKGLLVSLESVEQLLTQYKQRELTTMQSLNEERLHAQQCELDKERFKQRYEETKKELDKAIETSKMQIQELKEKNKENISKVKKKMHMYT